MVKTTVLWDSCKKYGIKSSDSSLFFLGNVPMQFIIKCHRERLSVFSLGDHDDPNPISFEDLRGYANFSSTSLSEHK